MLTLALAIALADTGPTERTAAAMISPLGTTVGVVSTALGTTAIDATLRAHHASTPGVGWSTQADFTHAAVFDMKTNYAGLRGGPRFSLRKRGLDDWTVTPFVSAGVTTLAAADERLARYGVLALGAEAGRTWVWNRFVMELGVGAYAAIPVGFASPAEAMKNETAASIFPVKPTFTWSVGYAF